ncbi:acyl-CoA thioesterase I [Marmoricola sp. URHA0025 HA25]
MIVRRGTLVAAGAVVAVLAGVLILLASGGATGDNAQHCVRLSDQSLARERMVTGHGRRVVVIGDSYSVGLGLSSPATSWPSRLPGRVHVSGFSGSGFSVHSSTCAHVSYAARAPHALRDGADLVVVEGGLNDYDQPTSAVQAGFRSLMAALSGRQVLVVGPPPAPARAAAARRVDALLSAESARAHVHYLSMIDESLPYLADRLHLTPSGHVDFGNVVARTIRG